MVNRIFFPLLGLGLIISTSAQAQNLLLDFNSGKDSLGHSQGNLVFNGTSGFQVTFTDDGSNGPFGGKANGVQITNLNYGNIKVGNATDFVLSAFNNFDGASNYHSSGIVALFNQDVTSVSLNDTDDDGTTKSLFAFDANGKLIGQTPPRSQAPASISTADTGGVAIRSVEFDTLAGTAGGSNDGTFFTIDNFRVQYSAGQSVPEPGAMALLTGATFFGGSLLLRRRRE